MKINSQIILPLALFMDLLLPFLLAPSYKGYQHLKQVMSVLGNDQAPLHMIYNIWLIILGVILLIYNFKIYDIVSQHSSVLAILISAAIVIYAIGGCILSGLCSVGDTKELVTIPQKIHGYGSVFGFMALLLTPLFLALYGFQSDKTTYTMISLVCFICALITFTLFVMADKPSFQTSIIAYEGLWQRLSLMFMYLPLACIYVLK